MTSTRSDPAFDRLTARECDCLRLVAEHHSSKTIGRRLGLSPHTVNSHLDKAREKLGVEDRFEAARRFAAHERGLPTDSGPDGVGMAEDAVGAQAAFHGDSEPDPAGPAEPRTRPLDASETPAVARGAAPLPRNTLGVSARLAAILAIAAGSALAFGALLAGARALQDIALTLAR